MIPAAPLLLVSVLALAFWPPPTHSCERGTPRECAEAELAPGSNLAGEGFDISKMQRKGSFVIDMARPSPKDRGCTLCRNPYMEGKRQKLPGPVVDWRPSQKCSVKVSSSVYQSSEALVDSSSSSIENNWSADLNIDTKSVSGTLMVVGTNSKLAEYSMEKTKRDKFSFASQSVSCGYYSYRVTSAPPLHPEFKRALSQLPREYNPQYRPRFHKLINDFGTHFITKVTLGGKVHSVTSIKQCQASLQGLSVDEVKQCLDVEASLSVTGRVSSKADYKHCDEAKSKTESKSSFSSSFNDRFTEISGGQTTEPELLFSADKDPNAYKEWLASIPLNPDVISYSLLPLHELLSTRSPARKLLRRAVHDYVLERSLWRNCTEPCRVGARHSPAEPCSCTCTNNPGVTQDCCPSRRGLARLKVTVLRATGLWGDTTTATDGYVKVFGKNNVPMWRTRLINNNNSPAWAETFDLGGVVLGDFGPLRMEVWDEDSKWDDDLLGSCTVRVEAGTREDSCALNHGMLYYRTEAVCGPSLAGPACTLYAGSPMSLALRNAYVSRHARRPPPDLLQSAGVVPDASANLTATFIPERSFKPFML